MGILHQMEIYEYYIVVKFTYCSMVTVSPIHTSRNLTEGALVQFN